LRSTGRVDEGVIAERALAIRADREQPETIDAHRVLLQRRGRRTKDHLAGLGIEGDILEPIAQLAALVHADEVEPPDADERCLQPADHRIVAGGDGAVNALAGRDPVFAQAQSLPLHLLEEGRRDRRMESAFAEGGAHPARERGQALERGAAGGAAKEVLLDPRLGRGIELAAPIFDERGEGDRRGAAFGHGASFATPMQSRRRSKARCRMTRAFSALKPSVRPTSAADLSAKKLAISTERSRSARPSRQRASFWRSSVSGGAGASLSAAAP